jgi:O-antigen ligase
MRPTILLLRRRLPPAPRLERAAYATLVVAIAGLTFDDVLSFLFAVPLCVAAGIDLLRWVRTGRWPLRYSRLVWPVVVLGALALASWFWAESPRHTWSLFSRDYGRWALMLFLVFTHAADVRRLKWMVAAYLVGALIASLYALGEYAVHHGAPAFRAHGTFGHPNHLANHLSVAILLILGCPAASRRHRIANVMLLIPLVASLCLTLSRGTWIALIVGGVVLGWMRSRRLVLLWAMVAALVVILALLLPAGYARERIRGLLEPDRWVGALYDRPAIWRGSLRLIAERPIIGHGWGHKNFHHAWKRLPDRPPRLYGAAHNTVLHLLFELGILGLLIHGVIYGMILMTLIRGYRAAMDPYLQGLLAALLAIGAGGCLLGFTIEHLLLEQMLVIIGALSGLGLAAARLAEEEKGG